MLWGLLNIHVHFECDHRYGYMELDTRSGHVPKAPLAPKNPTYEGGPNVFHGRSLSGV